MASSGLCSICVIFIMKWMVTMAGPCDSPEPCPASLPYCTPVGCVDKCPEDSFVNGSECVTDCGHGVASNSVCMESCPPNRKYIYEKIVLSMGTFRKVRLCLTSCGLSDKPFADTSNTCVKVCLEEQRFINGDICSSKCSDNLTLMYENTESQSTVMCVSQCPADKPYSKNSTCVNECPESELLLDDKCVEQCPNSSYIVYSNRCLIRCPSNLYRRNSTCVQSCVGYDNEKLFITPDGSCIAACPDDLRFFRNTSVGYVCEKDCGTAYTMDKECVTGCLDFKFNHSCFHDCPRHAPYKYISDMYFYRDGYGYVPIKQCVIECPDGMYHDEYDCVTYCREKIAPNRTCVQNCPNDHPFSYGNQCTDNCPTGTYFSNYTCVSTCDNVRVNETCLLQCPVGLFALQGVCVQNCPNDTYYRGTDCVFECAKLHFNRTCVDHCPSSLLESQESCVNFCPQKMFTDRNRCISTCSNKRVNTTCVDQCPDGLFDWQGLCLTKCPYETYIGAFNNCVSECGNLYRLNDKCVDSCPPEQPLIDYDDDDILEKKGKCVRQCGGDKLANDKNVCIRNYECKKTIKFNGRCLDACPEGTFWVGDFLSDVFEKNCQSIWIPIGAIIASVFLMIIQLIVCTCIWCFRLRPIAKLFDFYRRTQNKRRTDVGKTPENTHLLIEEHDGENTVTTETHNFVV